MAELTLIQVFAGIPPNERALNRSERQKYPALRKVTIRFEYYFFKRFMNTNKTTPTITKITLTSCVDVRP